MGWASLEHFAWIWVGVAELGEAVDLIGCAPGTKEFIALIEIPSERCIIFTVFVDLSVKIRSLKQKLHSPLQERLKLAPIMP